jgi:hypothetical protein
VNIDKELEGLINEQKHELRNSQVKNIESKRESNPSLEKPNDNKPIVRSYTIGSGFANNNYGNIFNNETPEVKNPFIKEKTEEIVHKVEENLQSNNVKVTTYNIRNLQQPNITSTPNNSTTINKTTNTNFNPYPMNGDNDLSKSCIPALGSKEKDIHENHPWVNYKGYSGNNNMNQYYTPNINLYGSQIGSANKPVTTVKVNPISKTQEFKAEQTNSNFININSIDQYHHVNQTHNKSSNITQTGNIKPANDNNVNQVIPQSKSNPYQANSNNFSNHNTQINNPNNNSLLTTSTLNPSNQPKSQIKPQEDTFTQLTTKMLQDDFQIASSIKGLNYKFPVKFKSAEYFKLLDGLKKMLNQSLTNLKNNENKSLNELEAVLYYMTKIER